MKTYLIILSFGLITFSSCTVPQGVQSRTYNDDVYYSSKDAATEKDYKQANEAEQQQRKAQAEKEKNLQSSENSNRRALANDDYYTPSNNARRMTENTNENGTSITNNYYETPFSYDDYYADAYAVRLKRFHHSCPNYSYYDNYYTNSYWYNGDPFSYGTSIYMGYNFWGQSYFNFVYNPSYYWYSNIGWGGNDPWYNPYGYHPFYSYGYNPYGYGYANGYYNGYSDGYYHGLNNGGYINNYFNSYDNNSYYYGPRKTTGSTERATTQPTLAHRYMDNMEAEVVKQPANNIRKDFNSNETPKEITPHYLDHRTDNQIEKSPAKETNRPVAPSNLNNKPATINNERPIIDHSPVEKPLNNFNNNNYQQHIDKLQPTEAKPSYERGKHERPQYEKPKHEQPRYDQPTIRNEAPQNEPRNNPSRHDNTLPKSSPSPSRPRR